MNWLLPSFGQTEYFDEVIYSSDGTEFKWVEHIQLRLFPSLQSLATRRYNKGIVLHLDMPFTTQTLDFLLKYAMEKTLPDKDWLQMENVLLELKNRNEPELVRCREIFLKSMTSRRCASNCFGLWRLARRLRSNQSHEIFNYILENLIYAVKHQTIDVHFYNLSLFELMLFLSHDGLKTKNELDVCDVALAWINVWPDKRRRYLKEILTLVRREGIPESTKVLAGKPLDHWKLSHEKSRSNGCKLILLGGHQDGPMDTILLLDYVNETWEELALKLPYQAAYHGAVWLSNELYIFGGGNNMGTHFNELYKLNQTAGRWEMLAPMNERRCYITNSSVELNGMIYVMGGHNGARSMRTRLRTVEYYNPILNTWTACTPMIHSRSDAAAAVISGRIFVCGGFNGREILATVEWFDPDVGIWTEFKQMPEPRAGLSAFSDTDGCLTVLGGFNGRGRFGNQWKHDCKDGTEWRIYTPMKQSRSNFSVAKLGQETVVVGGYYERTVDSVEYFDGFEWKKGPSLVRGRSALKVLALPLDAGAAMREQFRPQ